jgi:hypothetical protein
MEGVQMKNIMSLFRIILISTLIIALVGCASTKKVEVTIPTISGFSSDTLKELAKYGDGKIALLSESEFDNIDTSKFKIVYVNVQKEDRPKAISNLKQYFNGSEYQVFYSSISYDKTPEKICLLKSRDKYSCLSAFKTNGINYDINTNQLIEKIKKWDSQYKIDIIGVDGDWVDIKFSKLPKDIEKFANEIYEFCPDSVDQGVGEISELVKVIRDDEEVFLWWD